MATWHQQRARVRLYDDVLWNVVIDPPNAMRCIMQFATEANADSYLARLAINNPQTARFSYKLAPAKREG